MGNVNERVTVTNEYILQGAGKLYVNDVEAGGYQGGLKQSYTQTESFIASDCQGGGEIDGEITKTGYEFSTELEESTLENVAWAMYGINSSSVSSNASSKTLNLIPPKSMIQLDLKFETMSGLDRTAVRTYHLPKVVKIGSTGQTFKRGEKTVIPVTIKALMGADGSYGTISEDIPAA